MTRTELFKIRGEYVKNHYPYKMTLWNDFNYKILNEIMYLKRSAKGHSETYSDCIIALDTETSKSVQEEYFEPEYFEIKNRLHGHTYNFKRSFLHTRTLKEYKALGIDLKRGARLEIDSLYSDLRLEYPYLFDDLYNEDDELEAIAEYLETHQPPEEILDNYIVAFTISIRAFHYNIVTLYGHNPKELAECLERIRENIAGDIMPVYVHNLPYDWTFARRFLFERFGTPCKQLNVKSHYPLFIKFDNGIMLKDSLMLAQKSLEKWANDLDVEHKKAVGKWDYERIRHQASTFSKEELTYIENDTLALCECIDKLLAGLHKSIATIPYTATGIPRNDLIKIGKEHKAKDLFNKIIAPFELYQSHEQNVFHGGYTHANRFFIEQTIDADLLSEYGEKYVICKDFTSSYPYVMLSEKYPMSPFVPLADVEPEHIINKGSEYAFIFRLNLLNVRLKNRGDPMPCLQYSKCTKIIGELLDNGRILRADMVEIYLNEIDFKIIYERYTADIWKISDCYFSHKDYLPRWYTDYIFELFKDKCTLKGKDTLNYMIQKGKLNSCYGMSVQKPYSEEIIEDYETGDYEYSEDFDAEYEYNKYMKNFKKILPYQWGIWVTSYAFQNLFVLGGMAKEWIYSDTDSGYAIGWDEKAVKKYNENCLKKLQANGYGAVEYEGKTYILGQAVTDGLADCYTEFRVLGAKRYCGRSAEDGKLHITVAGVPKKTGALCLKDDINKFTKGFCFDGKTTGKLQHTYINGEIRQDKYGNWLADSINLSKCDYILDNAYKVDIEDILFMQKEEMQIYEA